jgi:hypothetical protein
VRELAHESISKYEVKDEHEQGNAFSPPWAADDDHAVRRLGGRPRRAHHRPVPGSEGQQGARHSQHVVPDTPDPHWQVVDSDGQVYLLDKLKKKALLGDKYQKEIVLPSYVKNVKKVVIWCAWAEANLGEASFSSPVM